MDRLFFDIEGEYYVTSDRTRFVALKDISFLGDDRPTISFGLLCNEKDLVDKVEELAAKLPKGINPNAYSCAKLLGDKYVVDFLCVNVNDYVCFVKAVAR